VYESRLRDEQAAATRQRILATLSDLLVTENPALVSIPMVAKKAGVAVRTVYRHFPTKEDMFNALFAWATDLEAGAPPGAETVRSVDDAVAIVRTMFERIGRNLPLHAAVRHLPEDRALRIARLPRRQRLVENALAEATEGMPPERVRKVGAVVHLLTSSDALLFMHDLWGLTPEEAADACSWAIRAVAEKARRTKGAP
jgi:AcrR family transcriptional regulator